PQTSACSAAYICRSTASPRACATRADVSFRPAADFCHAREATAELQSAPLRVDKTLWPSRQPPRPTRRGRLQFAASAFVVLAALAWCHTAHAESIMQQVFDVEARYGNDPNDVIAHLRAPAVPG